MAVPIIIIVLIVLAAATWLTPWRGRKVTPKVSVGLVANIALLLLPAVLLGWLLGHLDSALPSHVTYQNLAQLGPVATAFTALVALVGVGVTVWQKADSDRRDAWWDRTQWALTWALDKDSDPARLEAGWAAVNYQRRSRLAQSEERDFLRAVVDRRVDPIANEVAAMIAETSKPGTGSTGDVPSDQKEAPLGPEQEEGDGHDD